MPPFAGHILATDLHRLGASLDEQVLNGYSPLRFSKCPVVPGRIALKGRKTAISEADARTPSLAISPRFVPNPPASSSKRRSPANSPSLHFCPGPPPVLVLITQTFFYFAVSPQSLPVLPPENVTAHLLPSD